MASSFGFLADDEPDLHALASHATAVVYDRPAACLRELRTFGEAALKRYVEAKNLPEGVDTQFERIDSLQNAGHVPRHVGDAFHSIRMAGNDAIHDDEGTAEEAVKQLRNAHCVADWIHQALHGGGAPSDFVPPTLEKQTRVDHSDLEALSERLRTLESSLDPADLHRLQNRINDLESRQPEPTDSFSSHKSTHQSSKNTSYPTLSYWPKLRELRSSFVSIGQKVKRNVSTIAQCVMQGLTHGVSYVIRAVQTAVRLVARWTRRLVWATVLILFALYLPVTYEAGLAQLREDAKTDLPTVESVAAVHRLIVPQHWQELVLESAKTTWQSLKSEGLLLLRSVPGETDQKRSSSSSTRE